MSGIQRLLDIMARLRNPQRGCPWDLQQSFKTIAPYTVEEAYEVADAIERDDLSSLRDELGDLLFQVVFHAQMAKEQGAFDFDAVANAICDKMERRHPHVFGDASIADAEAQTVAWEEQKRRERAQKRAGAEQASVLDDVPVALPALTRANKLGKRAAQVGFEWSDVHGAIEKLDEEIAEFKAEVRSNACLQTDPTTEGQRQHERLAAELGDVLFCVVNVCRYLKIDPELALKRTNASFERRFRYVERGLAKQGKTPQEATLAEMDQLWDEGKAHERRES
ncbi:nucleoside triphosphate pyrophosphohydrolase [Steroidobacter agaridevorans]|uniref:Nucleoside triphosphate pyrophosphohydrolase n=1 Tax=Steroidobacter agaridevorans TaxID=2695856 RepID=A0A829YJY6_9GAMM|nr:nucleoside triphosphate pyrophosphohydrolase [Steroidobacter agaridevorans]GFE83509.1 nucleoside triphosphate pyrophosphohydrolase [Steroidobacter agaridevorans]